VCHFVIFHPVCQFVVEQQQQQQQPFFSHPAAAKLQHNDINIMAICLD
jgi:hypothetical protein